MIPQKRYLAIGGAMVAAVAIAATVAGGSATAGNGEDQPLTGDTYDRAVAAALEHTGGGEVTEIGDDGAAYEVEVRLSDGSQVEVNLDADFVVTGSAPDDGSGESEGSDSD